MTKRANDYLICSVWVRAVFSVLSDTLRPCGSYFHRILWRELSSVHRILQARILEWVAMPSSRRFSGPRDGTHVSYVSALAARFFTTSATWERKWSLSRVRLFAIPRTVTHQTPPSMEFSKQEYWSRLPTLGKALYLVRVQ